MSSEALAPIFNCSSPPIIVPVVTPGSADRSISGRVRNVEVRALDTSGWLERDGDEWILRKSPERQGYMLLVDAYRAEKNEDGWALYQRYLKDWRKGRTSQSFPLHLLPELVQKRQRGELSDDQQDPWMIPPPKPTTGAPDRPADQEPARAPGKARP